MTSWTIPRDPGTIPAMSRHAKWWQLGLLSLASLLLLFLLLEVAARTLSWRMGKGFWSRPHSFESAFFVTYDWPPPLLQEDRGTFRAGQTVAIKKAPDELRVICLGGSTTVNARNAEGLTYSLEVQAALQERFPQRQITVLNAGADAFSTAHSLANLSLRLLSFEPDVVTVLHNINDLSALGFGDRLQPDYSNKYLDDAFLAYEHRQGFGGMVLRLSRGAQMLKWRLNVLKNALESGSRSRGVVNADEGPRTFERNLRSIIALARAHGVQPVLVTQAHREGEASAENGQFQRYNDITRSLGQELTVPVADVGQQLSGQLDNFLDPVHLTSDGIRSLAAVLTPVVAEALFLAPHSSKGPASAPADTEAASGETSGQSSNITPDTSSY